jgi:death-on-curing protein
LVIAEAVTGIDSIVLANVAQLGLLDSALHAPEAGFADFDLYPEFVDKAAVLAVRLARNHPLPDGNKRLAWGCLTMFCSLNSYELVVPVEDAVSQMVAVAAGEVDEEGMARWLSGRIEPAA